jgi:hypothetical protein
MLIRWIEDGKAVKAVEISKLMKSIEHRALRTENVFNQMPSSCSNCLSEELILMRYNSKSINYRCYKCKKNHVTDNKTFDRDKAMQSLRRKYPTQIYRIR